jgi:ribonuclease P protein component
VEVRVLASLLLAPRAGVIVPKHGHTAVARNVVKRRLREILRTEVLAQAPAVDLVLRALPPAYSASYDVLKAECLDACRRGGALAR